MTNFFSLSLLVSCLMISGSNTMEGLGNDIKKGGEALSQSAESANPSKPKNG